MTYYTDGSAHPTNPGPGGFGVVLLFPDGTYTTYSKQTNEITTNNREEIKAILYATCDAILRNEKSDIYSDSSYAINTLSSWMYGWQNNGWLKRDGGIPENLDLIQAYMNLPHKELITFHKVKGHNKVFFNELADQLARGEEIDNFKSF